MSSNRTEHQSGDELRQARELSLEPARPPAQVPGYKLQQFIGSGAYGEVWSGTDQKTGRRVAIKFYTRRSRNDVELLAREVEKLVVLSADRYVVQLLDVGWDADPPFYVMEYLEHGSLEDRLKSGLPLPVPDAVDLFQEVATGMMHLHGKGILHCDLKPGNVLLDQDGKPRVADFGQSRLSTDETPALGTLFYMAPEQADITAIPDAKWDVYGLGALLYSMIVGKPPYYSAELAKEIETTDEISDRLSKYRSRLNMAKLPTDHRNVPGVDRALADIIDRCIAANPKERFGSIQSVLLALRTRELSQARKPLMLLGIIAPLLLMATVSLFGIFAFNEAISKTRESLSLKAEDSNFFAARLAARSAAEQIDEYFRVVAQLVKDEKFTTPFDQVIANPELAQMRIALADPAKNFDQETGEDPLAELRGQFASHPERIKLQPELERRLFDPDKEFPPSASWFVCDRYGNQIASAFRKENRTLGNNYSFRTYFTGLSSDLDANDSSLANLSPERLEERQVIQATHLSAVFRSQQTLHWKLAIAAPIIRNGVTEGVVAVTVDLGEFVDFEGGKDQYAILVDGREGENTGAVLEHPVFKEYQKLYEKGSLSEELATTTVDLDLAVSESPFYDPISNSKFGKQLGYGEASIVSIVNVHRSERKRANDQNQDTDGSASAMTRFGVPTNLYIVAVQNNDKVLSDVNALGAKLRWLALMAILALLLVGSSIAFIVNRMLRESREKLSRGFSPTRDTSPIHEMETIHDGRAS